MIFFYSSAVKSLYTGILRFKFGDAHRNKRPKTFWLLFILLKGIFAWHQKPIKITNEDRKNAIKEISPRNARTEGGLQMIKDFQNALAGAKLFGNHFPYYNYLLTDSDGNILLFPNTLCKKNCDIQFRVYSKEGQFICCTKININNFDFKIDWRIRNIIFDKRGIFGIFEEKNSDEESFRLVKVKLSPLSDI